MTKLEQKLIELGYERCRTTHNNFAKYKIEYNDYINIYFYCDLYYGKINDYEVKPFVHINDQIIINDLQQAYNQLQKDLEVLKEYE